MDILSWISSNAAALGIVVVYLTALGSVIKYFLVRKSENRKHTFAAYHKIIGDLVDPETPRLDRQIASAYELRNFKDYYPVTMRILKNLKQVWAQNSKHDISKLIDEIDLTIAYIKKKKKCLCD